MHLTVTKYDEPSTRVVIEMTSDMIQGIEAYEHYSKGIWGLAGDSMKDSRQRIMYLLTGKDLPKAKCGVTALEVAYSAAKIAEVR